ncbi:MAG: radical SAM protein [Desulfurococcaceae archaeon]
MLLRIAVIDALARATGKRYSTFDVVGAGPRVVAGIVEKYAEVRFYPYESALNFLLEVSRNDVVMISAMSTDFLAVSKLVVNLRRLGYKGLVIIGGPISFEYVKILNNIQVDLVVVGEAEIPLTRLMPILKNSSPDFSNVPGVAFKQGDQIKLTSKHIYTPIEVMESIKPWTRVNEAFKYPQIYRFYVEVVRGCSNYNRPTISLPGKKCISCFKCRSPVYEERLKCPVDIPPGCGFCSVPFMFGPARSRSIKAITDEVSELLNHGARRVVLSAPDFLDYMREKLVNGPLTDPCSPPANVDAIESLLNTLFSIEEIKNNKAVLMIENIKACLVDEEVGKVLGRYLKGTTVHIGLETGCNWFNEKVLGKPITLEHVLNASRILRRHGLRPYIYLMIGLPYATREVYAETLTAMDYLRECDVEKITLYKYMNLPATAFENSKPLMSRDIDDLIRKLRKTVELYNLATKRRFIGKNIEAWLLEFDGKTYGYPVKHGPVVFVENPYRRSVSGCRGIVKIVDIGPRFIKGRLVSILECPEYSQNSQ